MEQYNIILFKNKHKKRVIKKFITEKRVKDFFTNLIKKSEEVIFDVKFENGKEVNYELGIVEKYTGSHSQTYLTDNLGRNIKVKLDNNNMVLSQIKPYRKEEKIYDIALGKKISLNEFIRKYLKTDTLKVISILNNKVIIQKDESINVFSLKSEEESVRFVECLSSHFFKNKRTDCLFVKDISTPQRKYLIELLKNNGFDEKLLYRKYTTHPRKE